MASSKKLTMDTLRKKPLRTKDLEIELGGDVFTWKLQAISSGELDRLQNRFPPSKSQRENGFSYNIDKFAPALISACSVEPAMTPEEAAELWTSDTWSAGELNAVFGACTSICMNNQLVNPTEIV